MAPIVGICTVCRSNMKVTEVSALTCGHTFHYNCIVHWIQQSNSCPNCRRFACRRDLISRIFFLPPSTDGDDSSSIDSDENTPIKTRPMRSSATMRTMDQPSSFLPSGGASPVRRWDGRMRYTSSTNSRILHDINSTGIERAVEEEPQGGGWSATADEVGNDVEITPPQPPFSSTTQSDERVNWEVLDESTVSVDSVSDDDVVVLSERSAVEESDSVSVSSSELSSESSRSHSSTSSSFSLSSSSSSSDTSSDWSVVLSDSLSDGGSRSPRLQWSADAMISSRERTPSSISGDEAPDVIHPVTYVLTALKRAFESTNSDCARPSKRRKF
uniref:RING-type domain-containing protein n=3 Tax=Parascaris univalens TaxID=6257 RepID=A0A915BZ96_PARUN